MKPTITFLVDTREQRPLKLGAPIRTDYFSSAITDVRTLEEGDYIVTLDGRSQNLLSIRLERKSLGDCTAALASSANAS